MLVIYIYMKYEIYLNKNRATFFRPHPCVEKRPRKDLQYSSNDRECLVRLIVTIPFYLICVPRSLLFSLN